MKKLILAIAIVVYLGFAQKWHFTLSGDLQNYYYPIAKHIFTPATLIYPPGANLFFMLLPSVSFDIYQIAFVAANIILVFILAFLTKRPGLLSILVLCAGPIVLFRFDLLVLTLLLFSIVAFQKEKHLLSGFFLGLATMTKLFPAVLLPYFLLVFWLQKRNFKLIIAFLTSFVFATLLTFFLYAGVTQQNGMTILKDMNTVFSVSVHMESVVGSILTVITAFTNPGPHGVDFTNALWVLDPLYFFGHARIFKFISPLMMATVYLWVIYKQKRGPSFQIKDCLLIILALVVASQIFSPQYVLWPAFLFLLLSDKDLGTRFWKINLFLLLAGLVGTQLIYPLNYGELIDFFNQGINTHLFIILALRNLMLVILTLRLLFV